MSKKTDKATIDGNRSAAWNAGVAVGQKAPFTPDQADRVRGNLRADIDRYEEEAAQAAANGDKRAGAVHRKALAALRDLALFNTAVDTMLRASDLLSLKVIDVIDHNDEIFEEIPIRQKKTKSPHLVALGPEARLVLKEWILKADKARDEALFSSTGNRNFGGQLSRNQYGNLVKKWASYARLDPRRHATHSLRRSKSAAVYKATHNLRACQHLLGHRSIASTAAYLAVDQREALDLASKIKV